MITVMGSFTIHKFTVVLHESQRRIHLLIGQWPVPMLIVQIVTATLQKNPQWLGIGFADHRRIVMSTSNIDEAPHVTQHLLELIRPLPGDRESTDATTADSADRTLLG